MSLLSSRRYTFRFCLLIFKSDTLKNRVWKLGGASPSGTGAREYICEHVTPPYAALHEVPRRRIELPGRLAAQFRWLELAADHAQLAAEASAS